MHIRPLLAPDIPSVLELMRALWPTEELPDIRQEHIFVHEAADAGLDGFMWVAVRAYVEGSAHSPCPHVEGWFVQPKQRGKGIGTALMKAVEAWCVEQGFDELTSDTELERISSHYAHAAVGFEKTACIQYFRKKLS